jgi:hypothetical protein
MSGKHSPKISIRVQLVMNESTMMICKNGFDGDAISGEFSRGLILAPSHYECMRFYSNKRSP